VRFRQAASLHIAPLEACFGLAGTRMPPARAGPDRPKGVLDAAGALTGAGISASLRRCPAGFVAHGRGAFARDAKTRTWPRQAHADLHGVVR
jgi:hypothetical protein